MSDHYLPGVLEAAVEKAKGKVLPVVVYQDGVRHIIGEALVEEDGMLTAELNTDGFKILNLHADIRPGDFSIVENENGQSPHPAQESMGRSQELLSGIPGSSERLRHVHQKSNQKSKQTRSRRKKGTQWN